MSGTSHPLRYRNPGVGRKRKLKSRDITVAATFGALYAVLVVFLSPISFDITQFRVADMLLPLTIIFGWPAIIGITIGTGVANIFGGLGPIDIFGGSLANLLGCSLAYMLTLRLRRFFWPGVIFLGTWIINLVVTLIVGTYLAYLFGEPLIAGLLGIFIGSLVSVNIAGFALALLVYAAAIYDPQIRHLIKVSFKGPPNAR